MITLKGKIVFDPPNKTNKHHSQSHWKKIVIIEFENNDYTINDGICAYYAWFIEKRYSIVLNLPLRNAHVTLINDSLKDFGNNIDNWDKFKEKYNDTEIDVVLSTSPRTDSSNPGSTGHWWLTIPYEHRQHLLDIRKEIGLEKPYYGFHLSIGYANNKNIEQSKYIHQLIEKFGNEYE